MNFDNYTSPGLADFQTDVVPGQVEVFAGDTPAVVTISATYTGAQGTAGIPALTPVKVDFEGGAITIAATTADANAITTVAVKAGSPAGKVPVYKAGCFNVYAIAFPAGANTEALKMAFFSTLSNHQIYVKKPYYP